MPAFESIVVVEDWISDHYFTSEGKGETFQKQVGELRKQWDADAKEGHDTVLKRFSAARLKLQTDMAALSELTGEEAAAAAQETYAQLREVLGIRGQLTDLEFERGSSNAQIHGLWLGDTQDVLWLEGTPAAGDDALSESTLLGTNHLDNKERADQPLAKLLSELYLSEPSPKYIVVASGSSLFLTERERWPEGRYLSADVQLIADRNDTKKGQEVDRFLAIFGRQSIVPTADGTIWWDERLEESRKHAVGVSQDLRDGIRESIEIIANDVLVRRTAQGLSNDDLDGQQLARESLRFLYRILFLLYAEASPELGVLPKNQGEYDAGYGLERLRELVQVELPTLQSQQGTHLFESLNLLFRLVNGDHDVQRGRVSEQGIVSESEDFEEPSDSDRDEGLNFEPLEADLFNNKATQLITDAKLSNSELQKVLERLLLSKAESKSERGFISYANLGINQLGAVYEGLMSYTGFIAKEDLREVAKNGDSSKGSWVVPLDKIDGIEAKHYVMKRNEETGLQEPVHHPKGSFVFRLAGRERQQSASYYTPEVLTKFVVSQALEELLTDETPADAILNLSICEPALGSGAFAIEAVRQLADEYLKRKQRELDREIPADEYPQELQKVKAQIALHQVHGVDLNSTAVELAEVSLWLDTMQPGLRAPWFGLRLKRGNSLIGARRATYSVSEVKAKKYLSDEPHAHPLTGLAEAIERDEADPEVSGRIHHFLLPGEGWGAAADAKEVKDLAADEQKKLKSWAKSTKLALSKEHIARLQALSERVETLWMISLRRMQIAEDQAKRFVDYWPSEREPEVAFVSRDEIEVVLNDPRGSFQRLKRAMNAWNALWYWPLTEDSVEPPTMDDWVSGLEGLVGLRGKANKNAGQKTLVGDSNWYELNDFEQLELDFASASSPERLAETHQWLVVCDRIAEEQGFFHWELEFAPVFARGGFDLQVGNPPWVRPRSDEAALLAEHDAWWQLVEKPKQADINLRRIQTLADPSVRKELIADSVPTVILSEFLGARSQFSILSGLQPDLYRGFMAKTWSTSSSKGAIGLIHPNSHLSEKRALHLRASTYHRIRRLWAYRNKKKIFEDLTDQLEFGVHIYGEFRENPEFLMAASIYLPETVERSFNHDGTGRPPALKTDGGEWDIRGHAERLVRVNMEVLTTWAEVLDEPGTSPLHARIVYPVNRSSMTVLEKLSKAPKIRELGLQYSRGWDESIDRKKGYFEFGSRVNDSWNDVILQGPHFSVANPFSKIPRVEVHSNNDWDDVDLEAISHDFIPRTSYQPIRSGNVDYDQDYTNWEFQGHSRSARDFYRLAWRLMAATSSVRTLYPSILPKRAAHINGVLSTTMPMPELIAVAGLWSTICVDFLVKVSQIGNLTAAFIDGLPYVSAKSPLWKPIAFREAKLVFLTSAFDEAWESIVGVPDEVKVAERNAQVRRAIQIEMDALAAIYLGITADELCTIYRTQFPVLRGYEQTDLYDANGRKVPGEMNKLYRKVGESGLSLEDRKWTHPQSGVEYTFEFPFRGFDREEDMRAAYAKFSKMLEEHGEIIEESI